MAVPLSATFILDDKYSKALMEIVKNTQKADQATEQMKDTLKGVGDDAQKMESKVINPLDKIGKKMMGFVSIGYAVKKAFDLMWSGIQGVIAPTPPWIVLTLTSSLESFSRL